jgi:hypothetical protein
LFRYGLIKKVQDRKPAPTVRISASIMLARSRGAAPDRVSVTSPASNIGKHAPRKTASARDGNAVRCNVWLRTTAVMLPVPKARMPPPSSSRGTARRGRLRRTPTTTAVALVSTMAARSGRPIAGTVRYRATSRQAQPQ